MGLEPAATIISVGVLALSRPTLRNLAFRASLVKKMQLIFGQLFGFLASFHFYERLTLLL